MSSGWLHDVGVKQQLFTVCVTAVLVMAAESVLFFVIVIPMVRESMRDLIGKKPPVLSSDPFMQAVVSTVLEVADEQEKDIMDRNNEGCVVTAGAITAIPLLIVMMMYAKSSALRAAPIRRPVFDALVVAIGVIIFQGVFFLFSRRWKYPDVDELVTQVAGAYESHSNGTVFSDCAPCLERLQHKWNESPTIQKLRNGGIQEDVTNLVSDEIKRQLPGVFQVNPSSQIATASDEIKQRLSNVSDDITNRMQDGVPSVNRP